MTKHLTIEIPCPACKATGDDPAQPWKPCQACYGNRVQYVNAPSAPACYQEKDEPPGRDIDVSPTEGM